MGYSFRLQETVSENVRRIALEQVDKALHHATTEQPTLEICVHEIRKCLKRLRALVRLVRPQLDRSYERENAEFRATGQLLSTTRDADVMQHTFQNLVELYGSTIPKSEMEACENLLQQRVTTGTPDLREQLSGVVLRLENARYRIAQWPLHNEDFAAIAAGARAVYKRGKEAFSTTQHNVSAEHVHEVRKNIKYLWYHSRLLTPLWPVFLKEFSSVLSTLADTLGEHNDLAVFRATICATIQQEAEPAGENSIDAVALQRQQELWNTAVPLCMRVYAESPNGYVQRLRAYWDAWLWKSKQKPLIAP